MPDLSPSRPRRVRSLTELYHLASIPFLAIWILDPRRLHPSYGMTLWRRLRLVVRLYRNTRRIETGISYKAHVAMAATLLATPPEVDGVVVECGSWKGGTSANLSLICAAAGRRLVVYDSFRGLPAAEEGDRHARPEAEGMFAGDMATVRRNVGRYGDVARCEFRAGWFADTLPPSVAYTRKDFSGWWGYERR